MQRNVTLLSVDKSLFEVEEEVALEIDLLEDQIKKISAENPTLVELVVFWSQMQTECLLCKFTS